MGLESCVICLDNSEFMRNEDYSGTTRFESQADAALLIANSKLNSNPESTIAIVAMSNGVDVKLTLTTDDGSVNAAVRSVKVGGYCDLVPALQVSQLLLKNRQNIHGGQRIILFVGSPVTQEKSALERIGKALRKNGIAVDIISLGEEAENNSKLEAFVKSVCKKVEGEDNSHLVVVPPGPHVLSDILTTTPLFDSSFGSVGISGGGGGFSVSDAVDPNIDPELASVLEESRREQEILFNQQLKDVQANSDAKIESSNSNDAEPDEDELLRQALEMSIREASEAGINPSEIKEDSNSGPSNSEESKSSEMEIDDELRLAMEISRTLESGLPESQTEMDLEEKSESKGNDVADIMNDPSFLQSIIGEIEGVDPNDPRIQEMFKNNTEKKEEKDKK